MKNKEEKETFDGKTVYIINNRKCIFIDKRPICIARFIYERFHNVKLAPNDRMFYKDNDPSNLIVENLIVHRKIPIVKINAEEGTVTIDETVHSGHKPIRINGKQQSVHVFIYEKFHNIELKKNQHIFHKDGNKENSRIDNLGIATNYFHSAERKKNIKNTTGYRGISFGKKKIYQSQITCDGIKYHLGHFKNIEDAIRAWNDTASFFNRTRGTRFELHVI